jgi:cellulose biosynthesis protein BcsQ
MAEEKKKSKKISFKEEMKKVKKAKPKMRGRTLFSPAMLAFDTILQVDEDRKKAKKYLEERAEAFGQKG